jgi:hypothetical protein
MTRKPVARDQLENPKCGTVRWPVGNSGKIHMRFSQHSTEKGISVNEQRKNLPQYVKTKVHAYKVDFLVQPKHTGQNKHPECQKMA